MPFDLPEGYLLGMTAWLAAGAASLVLLLKLRRRGSRSKGAIVSRVALAGLSLWMFLAALTLVELFFALVYDQSDSFNMSNVSKHWFARHVRTNGDGFRDHATNERRASARRFFLRLSYWMRRAW